MTQKQADRLVAKWQKRLRLQDWRITVELTDVTTLKAKMGYRVDACVEWQKTLKKATLWTVADPKEVQDPLEQNIIHELMHLQFVEFNVSQANAKHTALEQAIDLTAWALYLTEYPEERKKYAKH